ncbi:DUF1549 domain-containing protein [Akkermansiaceae bacterium]|nr:DUF1549 domain-containing protein [Akkermansiaceae bacterium]
MKPLLQIFFCVMLALSGNALAKKKKDVEPSNHWSFQPVAAKHRHGRVDAFLNEAMANKNLRPLGRAERRTLIRRAYLVMLGLPPSPEEVAQFLDDDSPPSMGQTCRPYLGQSALRRANGAALA